MADDEVYTKVEKKTKVDVEMNDAKDDVKEDLVKEVEDIEDKEDGPKEKENTPTPEAAAESSAQQPDTKLDEDETTPEPVAGESEAAEEPRSTAVEGTPAPIPGTITAADKAEANDQNESQQLDARSEKDLAEDKPEELAAADEIEMEESELTPEHTQEEDNVIKSEKEVESEQTAAQEAEITSDDLAARVEEALVLDVRSEDKFAPAIVVDEAAEVKEASRSSSSLRRASGHTEALIQAAAKEVLERLEAQTMETMRNRSHSSRDSMGSTNDGTEIHYDARSDTTRRESYDTRSEATRHNSYASQSQSKYRDSPRESRRESRESRESRRGRYSCRESDALPTPMQTEDGGDSSSQHGADSDVFSERSARSSLGSFDGGHMDHHRKEMDWRSSKRSSGMSDVSMSDISYYDREEFVPTIRGTQRMPFRTPSDVKAMQYSSPAPSVIGSPRSGKRPQMSNLSRFSSPTVSAQYSPKGRTTPTRLKVKKEPAPLVLLHVTLLPLRWQWAEILENTPSDNLSAEAKNLREAWHHLHDRVAETVCERGILLSHPQDDYEILEERLLEALDLPLRRRARVLECGHYIGPSNESTMTEEFDSDEEEYDEEVRKRNALAKTHWCPTCRHDIRYESLGPGKIFRIKVYASNGLMRTGAWAACWKEMERVDVEIEPIVTSGVLDELERLVIAQSQQMVKHENPTILESTEDREMTDEHDMSAFDCNVSEHHLDRSMPALEEALQEPSFVEESNMIEPNYSKDESYVRTASADPVQERFPPSPEPISRHDQSEERRLRDEARMREIYGQSPPALEPEHEYRHVPEPEPEPEAYAQTPPPQQPQEQHQQQYHEPQHQQQAPSPQPDNAFDQHQERQRAFQNAGLGELLLEAARVFMQDKKNLAIVVMGLLMLFMAVKPAQREVKEWDGRFIEQIVPEVQINEGSKAPVEPPIMETVQSAVESVTESIVSNETLIQAVIAPSAEAQVLKPSQEMPLFQPTTASAAEPSESSVNPVDNEELSSSSVEELVEDQHSPSPEPSSVSFQDVEILKYSAVHQTITTREVIRIMETVTETVKAFVTETELVKLDATPSVVSELAIDEDAENQEESSVEEKNTEEELASETEIQAVGATETAAPFEEPFQSAISEDEPGTEDATEEATEQEAAPELDDHDEL